MADADLDALIRQLAKQQNKALTAAVKKRRDRAIALAAKAKDAGSKQRQRQLAGEQRIALGGGHDDGTAGARSVRRLRGKTSMQWVTSVTYCCGSEAASGQAEEAEANGEPGSQSRQRRGASPNATATSVTRFDASAAGGTASVIVSGAVMA